MSHPGPWARWVARTSRREAGDTLAAVRICVGLAVVLNLGATAIAGVPELSWIDAIHGGAHSHRPERLPWLIATLGGPTPAVIWGLLTTTMVAALALTLGCCSRLAALIAGQGLLALRMLNPFATGAYDALMTNALWILVLCDASATASLRCRLRTGAWTSSDCEVAAWPRYLLVFQLGLTYTMAGIQKVSAAWMPGDRSALYRILQMPAWARFDMRWLARPGVYALTELSSVLVWLFELSWPLLLIALALGRPAPPTAGPLRRALARYDLRLPYLAFGLTMHLGIAVLMAVGPFHWIMLAYYLALARPGELRQLAARLTRRAH